MNSLLTFLALTVSQTPPASGYQEVLTSHTRDQYVGDLAEIRKRGVLRVLTRNNSSSYFISRGRQLGFEFELARAFAESIGVRLAIVVPKSRAHLITGLLRGEGDLIAAGMTASPQRRKLVQFSEGLFSAQRVLVTHREIIKEINSLKDMTKVRLALNRQSTTFSMAKSMADELGLELDVEYVPPSVEMEEILRRIETGEYEASIVDENVLALELSSGLALKARVPLGEALVKAWGMRPKSTELRDAVNAFIRKNKKSGLIRILYQRYFSPERRGYRKAKNLTFRADAKGRISPYDHLFKKAGTRLDIDWRLLAALAYAESRFDPLAKSSFGAIGLMQVLPSTASRHAKLKGSKEEIIEQLLEPTVNVRVGSNYLAWLIRQFENESVAPRQSIRFAMASYNVGLGHVKDSRALARMIGLDENRWFQNVEKAIRLKKDPRWYGRTRYGYCRADQPIAYVSRIQTRYDAYTRHVPFE